MYVYAGNNPVVYIDLNGYFSLNGILKGIDDVLSSRPGRFVLGLTQVVGGTIEFSIGLVEAMPSCGLTVYFLADGFINILDGVITMEASLLDNEYDGLISESVQFITTNLGMDEEMAKYYGDSVALIKDIIDIPISGGIGLTGNRKKLINLMNYVSTAVGISGISTDSIGVGVDFVELLE